MTDSNDGRPGPGGYGADQRLGGRNSDSATISRPASVPLGYIHGIDGKVYPRPLSKTDRLGLIAHVHDLNHQHHLSIRQIVGALETQHGLHRSVGAVSAYLNDYVCSECSGEQAGPPEHLEAAKRRREAALRSTPLASGRRDPQFGLPRDGGAA